MRRLLVAVLVAGVVVLALPSSAAAQEDEPSAFAFALCQVLPVGCGVVADAAGDALGSIAEQTGGAVLAGLAESAVEAVAWFFTQSVGWWVSVPSIVGGETEAVSRIGGNFAWLSAAMAMLGIIWQSIRVMVTRSSQVLSDLVSGLATISFVTAGGWLVVQGASAASDQWATYILSASTSDPALTEQLTVGLSGMPPFVAIGLGVLMLIAGAIQAALMLMRDVAVILLSGLLPFAASARLFGWGRSWLPKLTNSLLSLLLFKPLAAATLSAALALFTRGNSLLSVLAGAAMLVASIFMLPALMKLFGFVDVGGSVVSSGSGAAMAVGGVMGATALRSATSKGMSQANGIAADRQQIAAVRSAAAPAAATGAPAGGGAAAVGAAAGPVGAAATFVVQGAASSTKGAAAAADTGKE